MRHRKTAVCILALLLLLLCAPLALAQNNLPDVPANAETPTGLIIGCTCAFFIVALAINIAILVWVYKDAQARGAEPMLWLILVFFTGLIGLIIWLCVRRRLEGRRAYIE